MDGNNLLGWALLRSMTTDDCIVYTPGSNMSQIPKRICFGFRYIYKEHYFATHYSCGFEQRQVSA